MSKFVHLHVHTEHSPLDAPVGLKKLVKRAKELGYNSLGVSDHGTVSSWVKFAVFCKENNIKPIFGVEAYFTPDRHVKKRENYHLILIAKNNDGIKNIYKLSESACIDGFYYNPRIDWDLLEKYHNGIIATSACVSGIVPEKYIQSGYDEASLCAGRFKDIFGEDFYIEVQYHNLEVEKKAYEGVAKIAKNNGIKIVGTNDVHYLNKSDASYQEVLMALNTGKCIKDPKRISYETNQFYLKNPDEMIKMFGGEDQQAVMSTLEIEEKCTAEMKFDKPKLPKIAIPSKFDNSMDYLEHIARIGLRNIEKEGVKEYEERFKEEINTIRKLKNKGYAFDRYFLIVHEYVNWAWNNGIRVGVGRGSGVGSLILYCLRITGIDPIPLGLLFERFLEEERNEMPDIDIDFDHERGNEVYDHICKIYGEDRCARIGTIGTYHAAGALRSSFRVFDPGNEYEKEQNSKKMSENSKDNNKHKYSKRYKDNKSKDRNETIVLANEIAKSIPRTNAGAPINCTLLKERAEEKPDEIQYLYEIEPKFIGYKNKWPEIFEFAEKIEGLIEKRGMHAAGVLITDTPTVDLVPKQIVKDFGAEAKSGSHVMATAFDMEDIEKLGGIKFDFLRTKVLSVINKTMATIKNNNLWNFPFDIDHVPTNDSKVLNIFAKGDTLAIFQFESDGMRRLLKDMSADSFEDIIAANALYRPGPMDNIPEYISRKKGSSFEYRVKILEPILKPTYGVIVYQEQVMKIVRELAGFSGSEADKVRKAMGKKKKDLLDQMKGKFIKGCIAKGTCSEQTARNLWDSMEKFGAYAFNKSHSAGYSYTAYQCAFLKCYFPEEYMSAQLSIEGGDSSFDVVTKYEIGTKNMGIELRPLDINSSKADYTVEYFGNTKAIRKGFKGIKGCGKIAPIEIVNGQPYKNFMDYCTRAQSGTQSNIVSALIENGAFDCFKQELKDRLGKAVTITDLKNEYEDKMKRAKSEKNEKGARKEEKEGIGSIFGDDIIDGDLSPEFRL